MSKSQHKGKELPPLSVIHAAKAGDAEAMDCILRYYGCYINKLCTRKFHDEYGHSSAATIIWTPNPTASATKRTFVKGVFTQTMKTPANWKLMEKTMLEK